MLSLSFPRLRHSRPRSQLPAIFPPSYLPRFIYIEYIHIYTYIKILPFFLSLFLSFFFPSHVLRALVLLYAPLGRIGGVVKCWSVIFVPKCCELLTRRLTDCVGARLSTSKSSEGNYNNRSFISFKFPSLGSFVLFALGNLGKYSWLCRAAQLLT